MEKIFKKTVAAAMAVALVGGGSSVAFGGVNLLTANAINGDGQVDVEYANVALDDSITLRFYVRHFTYSNGENYDNDTYDEVTLSGPNGRKVLTEPSFTTAHDWRYDSETDSYDYWKYDVYEYPLYANQLDKNVSISFKKDGSTVKAKVGSKVTSRYSYTVNKYCDDILNTSSYNGTVTAYAAQSLKNFGLAADNYFNGTSKDITFIDAEYDLEEYAPGSPDDVKFSLALDSKLAARVYIPDLPADAEAEDFTTVKGYDGNYCFELKGFGPTELDEFYYVFYEDYDFDFCPLSYCYRAIQSDDSKTVDIGKAIYEYFKYVCDYANNQ